MEIDVLLLQIVIFILGVTSIMLIAKKNKRGFVFGLLSQPLWFITTYQNEQWGMFLMSIVYTYSWIIGINEWFFKSEKETNTKKPV